MSNTQDSSRPRRLPPNDRRVTDSSFIPSIPNSLRRRRTWNWIALIFSIFTITGSINPPRQPFNCNDDSIKKTYTGDSVSILMLFAVILLVPPIIIGLSEATREGSRLSDSHNRRKFFKRWGTICGDYLLGLMYVIFFIELGKTAVGELRPHFMDSCRPDWKTINCSAGPVKEYTCTGTGPDWLVKRDIYKSFPSGHSALSFYSFVFTSMYSQARIARSSYSHLFRSWIQLVALAWALVCSLSRITDNRHHWWDVLVGALTGILGGYFTVQLIVQNNFAPKKEEEGVRDPETILGPAKTNNDKMTSL